MRPPSQLPWSFVVVLASCAPAAAPARIEPPAPARFRIAYAGTGSLEGHFRAPGEKRPFQIALDLSVDGEVRRVTSTTWTEADASDAEPETVWIQGDRVVREGTIVPEPDAAWWRQLAHLDAPRGSWQVAHATFGDVTESVTPTGRSDRDEMTAPAAITLAHHEVDLGWTAALDRAAPRAAVEALAMPSAQPAPPSPSAAIELEKIADGVYVAPLPATDTASVIVELADGLAVLETSLTVAQGEALVDALAAKFPGKPIRHVLFGHYHPHYTGGLRAFFAAGATLHAPPRGAALGRQIAARAFTLAPDRLARAHVAARVEEFRDRVVIEDGAGQRIEAIDLGAASDHTEEYVVFYLPRSGVLVQGDLGWGVRPDGSIRRGRRSAGLLRAIEERHLSVARVVQGWPLMPGHQIVTLAELRSAP